MDKLPNPFRSPPPEHRSLVEFRKVQPHLAEWVAMKLRELEYAYRDAVSMATLVPFECQPLVRVLAPNIILTFEHDVLNAKNDPLVLFLQDSITANIESGSRKRIQKHMELMKSQFNLHDMHDRVAVHAADIIFWSFLWMESKYANVIPFKPRST
jgi:hypothetical protein